jgi:GGDEF domain-containing protein
MRRRRDDTAASGPAGPRPVWAEGLAGVLDQASFEAALAGESARAARRGRRLGVALFAVEFPVGSDQGPSLEARDRVLREVATTLRRTVRGGERVGWVGGALFAWAMGVSDEFSGWDAAERVRRVLEGAAGVGEPYSVAASIADLGGTRSAQEALWRATVALYWGKANGTGVSFRYSPEVVALLAAEKRAGGWGTPAA